MLFTYEHIEHVTNRRYLLSSADRELNMMLAMHNHSPNYPLQPRLSSMVHTLGMRNIIYNESYHHTYTLKGS
jgi:hypothetical protein